MKKPDEVAVDKKPDLVILVAIWEFLSALLILIPIAAIVSFFLFASTGMWMWGWGADWGLHMPQMGGIAIFALGIVVFIMAAYFIIALLGGIGLLRGKEWGRILSIIYAAISAFWIPIGTIVGILILLYLVTPEVREHFS